MNDYNRLEFEGFIKEYHHWYDIQIFADLMLNYRIPLGDKYMLGFTTQVKSFQDSNREYFLYLFFSGRFTFLLSEYSELSLQIPARYFPAFGYWDPMGFLLEKEETIYYECRKKRFSYHIGFAFDIAIIFQCQYYFCKYFGLEYGIEIRHEEGLEIIPMDISYHRIGLLFNVKCIDCRIYYHEGRGDPVVRVAGNIGIKL